jgi:hypothetical protein
MDFIHNMQSFMFSTQNIDTGYNVQLNLSEALPLPVVAKPTHVPVVAKPTHVPVVAKPCL